MIPEVDTEASGGEFAPIGRDQRRAYRSLVRDIKLALLSEIGARAVYDHIERRARDAELARFAGEMNSEGVEIVARVQELLRGMGARPRRTSFRRRALARILIHGARVTGARPVLRLIHHAEETVGRWYADYAFYLVRIGDHGRARAFEELRAKKQRRALALGAWVDNIARRGDRRL